MDVDQDRFVIHTLTFYPLTSYMSLIVALYLILMLQHEILFLPPLSLSLSHSHTLSRAGPSHQGDMVLTVGRHLSAWPRSTHTYTSHHSHHTTSPRFINNISVLLTHSYTPNPNNQYHSPINIIDNCVATVCTAYNEIALQQRHPHCGQCQYSLSKRKTDLRLCINYRYVLKDDVIPRLFLSGSFDTIFVWSDEEKTDAFLCALLSNTVTV